MHDNRLRLVISTPTTVYLEPVVIRQMTVLKDAIDYSLAKSRDTVTTLPRSYIALL